MEGGRPFELFFKSGDMNDVLKSLAMVDLSGGASAARQRAHAEASVRASIVPVWLTDRPHTDARHRRVVPHV